MAIQNPCAHCGRPCPPHPHAGRPRKWCSEACRALRARPARKRTMPCARCGELMWRSVTSLPEGQAACLACRRRAKAEGLEAERAKRRRSLVCPECLTAFTTNRPNQAYCAPGCRESARARRGNGWALRPPVKAGSTTERGYGVEHQRLRAEWAPLVEEGNERCCLCGYLIDPGAPWHLDHSEDRTGYRGIAHADCNMRDGARRGNRRSRAA